MDAEPPVAGPNTSTIGDDTLPEPATYHSISPGSYARGSVVNPLEIFYFGLRPLDMSSYDMCGGQKVDRPGPAIAPANPPANPPTNPTTHEIRQGISPPARRHKCLAQERPRISRSHRQRLCHGEDKRLGRGSRPETLGYVKLPQVFWNGFLLVSLVWTPSILDPIFLYNFRQNVVWWFNGIR
jgi:hypothetical protein